MDLKQYRFALGGWSEQQAADALGVSLKTYRRYESGKVRVPCRRRPRRNSSGMGRVEHYPR